VIGAIAYRLCRRYGPLLFILLLFTPRLLRADSRRHNQPRPAPRELADPPGFPAGSDHAVTASLDGLLRPVQHQLLHRALESEFPNIVGVQTRQNRNRQDLEGRFSAATDRCLDDAAIAVDSQKANAEGSYPGDRFTHGLFHVQVFVVQEYPLPLLEQFLDKGTDTVGKLQGQADLEER